MNKTVERFLNDVCSCIGYKGVHDAVKEELLLHIEELTEAYMAQGYPEETAAEKAVADMGNAGEIGRQLHEKHKPQTEWSLLFLTALVSVFGILIMYASSRFENHPVSFASHILHVVLGAAALALTYFTDYTKLKKRPGSLFAGGVLLLAFCAVFGRGIGGWIRFGSISVSVNALAGILFAVAFCGFVEKYQGEGAAGIIKLLLWGAGSVLLFVVQPSLSMAGILFVAYAVVLLRAISVHHFEGNKKIQMISVLSLGAVTVLSACACMLLHSPYKVQKMLSFWNNGADDPAGSGWIYAMADKVRQSSGFIGKAAPLQEGSIDWVMPSVTTDFAFVNIIHTFGWIAAGVLVLIIAVLIVRMFKTSNKIKNPFGLYLSLISSVMLSVQFAASILMNLGLFPYMDVSLPFISYGGTNYIINMLYVGLILSVWRKNTILPIPPRNGFSKEKRITVVGNKLIIDFKIGGKKCKL